MLFSSVSFLFLFLPIVFALHLVLRGRLRNYLLLIASLFFYAWGEPIYVFLMLFSSLANYFLAFGLQREDSDPKREKFFLILTVVFNLVLLGYFKYANFFVDTANVIFRSRLHLPEILLPIGISFYTFQTMSYMFDVYRREVKVQRNYADLLLYITFFPQLIAGPIVKYHDVDEQINHRVVTWPKVQVGIKRFIIGLAKKVLIANQMAIIVDTIYNSAAWAPSTAWLSAIAYIFQIYFDFSGYSDMAIGLGLMFGFKFRENFDYPYISQSIREFWRRWHISLSTWFKEYLYIPLGGSRRGERRTIINYLIVFFLTGLWHGASWNFVLWGLYQWLFLVLERRVFSMNRWPRLLRHIYTLLVVITGFVIFRVENLAQIPMLFRYMFMPWVSGGVEASIAWQNLLTPYSIFMLVVAVLVSTRLPRLVGRHLPRLMVPVTYVFLWNLTLMALSAATYNPFIYFRF